MDAAKRTPGIIIWPEVPAPFSFSEPPFARRAETHRARGRKLFSGRRRRLEAGCRQENGWRPTASVLLNPAGERVYSYDKIHLLPFGEYVPLRGWLTFAKRLTADISDFTPGSAILNRAAPRRQIRHVHLLRSNFPQRSPPIHSSRRAIPGNNLKRRLVRPLLSPRATHDDGPSPRSRKSPLAPARHQQRLHRIHRPLRPHRSAIATGHPRPTRRPVRFPQRSDSVRPVRRLVFVALHRSHVRPAGFGDISETKDV